MSTKRCSWVISSEGKLLQANIGVAPKDDAANALKFITALASGETKEKVEEPVAAAE